MINGRTNSRKRLGHLWPLWIAIGCPLLLILFEASPIAPNFLLVVVGVPALLLIWAALGLWAGVLSIRQMGRYEWRRAMITAVLPITILSASLNFFAFIHFCNDAGDILHFAFYHQSYLREIQATPSNGEPRLDVINLGGMIWSSRGYVYDESDEVSRDASAQSTAWKVRTQGTELSCGYFARPIPGHFPVTRHWYVASFNC